jgi:hypothetical protein
MIMNSSFDECISECLRCALACEGASACLQEQDVKMMADCIKLDRDCADMCRLAATLMARESMLKEFCALCARICRACGEEQSTRQTTVSIAHKPVWPAHNPAKQWLPN